MKVYKLEVEFSNYKSYRFQNSERVFTKQLKKDLYSSDSIANEYNGMDLEEIEGTVESDYPKLWNASGTPLFSQKAKDVLEEIIDEKCEFINLNFGDKTYYVLHCINVIDALDYGQSSFNSLDTGLIVGVDVYSFLDQELIGETIFKILLNGNTINTEVFVTEQFKKLVENYCLKGFKFSYVYG